MIECREVINSAKNDDAKCGECEQLQKEFEANPGGKPIKRKGLIVAAIAGGAAIALSAICLPFVTPALRRICLPYVPATDNQVQNVIKSLKQGKPTAAPAKTLVDIGSGDGRIVLAAAQQGYAAHGIELNPWLVLYSKYRAFRMGLYRKATFSRQDLWKADLGRFQNVVIFGVDCMMDDLEKKLDRELCQGSKVVACRYPFPTWTQSHTIGDGIDAVWTYFPIKPSR